MSTENVPLSEGIAVESKSYETPNNKVSKIDMKRAAAHQERRRRLINKGVPENMVDQAMQNEDFDNLPLEKRVSFMVDQTLRGFANQLNGQLQAIHHNQFALADALEVNSRSMAKCLEAAGISLEKQSEIIKAVEAEYRKEMELRQAEEMKKQEEARAKKAEQTVTEALEAAESLSPETTPTEAQPIPDGATTFGG